MFVRLPNTPSYKMYILNDVMSTVVLLFEKSNISMHCVKNQQTLSSYGLQQRLSFSFTFLKLNKM